MKNLTPVCDIRKTIRGPLPRIVFEKIARSILGTHYSLSLVVCGDALAQRLNAEYRKKSYKPNVLSFSLSKTEGEIILNVRKAEREAREYGVPLLERITFLFIHGCLHLKGHDHGNAMEALETKFLKSAL